DIGDGPLSPVDPIVPLVDTSQHLLQRHWAVTGTRNNRDQDGLLGLAHSGISIGFKSSAASFLKCRFCNFTAKFASWVARHERTHTKEKPYSCSYCGGKFNRKDALTVHVITVHKGFGAVFEATAPSPCLRQTATTARQFFKDFKG
ncbi:zinc finger protein-like, partial [Tropilaelaps mercedesae]